MNPLLDLIPKILGLLPALLLAGALAVGVQRSFPQRATRQMWRRFIVSGLGLWVVGSWTLVLTGAIAYTQGDVFPRFLVALAVPVAVGLGLLRAPSFQTVLDRVPVPVWVGAQAFRLLGTVFLLVPAAGLGPIAFTSAGWGDLATGTLAIAAAWLWARGSRYGRGAVFAFTAVGLFDLTNVARILLVYYPAWTHEGPTTEAATLFPMALVPAIAAPVALVLHVYVIRALLRGARPGA